MKRSLSRKLGDNIGGRVCEYLYQYSNDNGETVHRCCRTYCSNIVESVTRLGRKRGNLYLCSDVTCQSQCEWGEDGVRCTANSAAGSARFCGNGNLCSTKFVQDRGLTSGSRKHYKEMAAALREAKAAGRISK
jgi:RNase P/RNase MRP subunit POP5